MYSLGRRHVWIGLEVLVSLGISDSAWARHEKAEALGSFNLFGLVRLAQDLFEKAKIDQFEIHHTLSYHQSLQI
jgi:hypothetical protein